MKKCLLVAGLTVLLVLFCVPIAFAADDTTAPALTEIRFSSDTYNRGDTLTVSVIATELESGFDLTRCSISFLIKNPIEYEPSLDYFTLKLNTLCDGGVQGSVVLDERVGGTFEVCDVVLTDARGNIGHFAKYYENLPDASFTLISDYVNPGLPERPVCTYYELSKTTARPGDTVTYTIIGSYSAGIVSADLSLQYGGNTVWSPIYNIVMAPVAGQPNTFSGVFTVPADMYDGIYYPSLCFTTGLGERIYTQFESSFVGEHKLTVMNPSMPLPSSNPKFISYSVSTHSVYAGQQVTVSLSIDPQFTPLIKNVCTAFVWRGSDSIVIPECLRINLVDQGNGLYRGTAMIPVTTRPGEYCLTGFSAMVIKSEYIISFGGNDSDYFTDRDCRYLNSGKLTVNSPISISGTENKSILVGDIFDATQGVSATNAYTGDITDKITVVGGDIDTSAPGIYLVKYLISDTVVVDGTSYPVSYTDYRWIGVTEAMPQSTNDPLVITDGSITVGVDSSEATLSQNGTEIAFTNTLTAAGSYVISTDSTESSGTAGVAFTGGFSDTGHPITLAASNSRAIVTLAGSDSSTTPDTKSASLVIDRDGPVAVLQCYINSESSITVKANAADIAGVEVTKWAKGEQSISYFADGGTVFIDSFQADSYGKYTVYSRDTLGNESVTVADVQPVGIPASMQAKAVFNGGNAVSWGSVSGATGYQISRSFTQDGIYAVLTETSSKTYSDTAATPGQTCYYIVRAFKTSGNVRVYSAASSVANAKPVPSTPSSPAAAMAGYNSIKISWNAVEGASGYRVYRATSADGTYSYVCSGTSSLSYTNKYLSTGRTYYYKVRAYRYVSGSRVYGDYCNVVSATPLLSPVTSASASAYYPTSIKISWSSVPGRSRYEVWRSTEENGEYVKIGTTTRTYYKNTGLTPFVTYYYKIKVYRTVSRQKVYGGEFSPVASARPILNDVTNVSAAMYSASSIKVSWSSVYGSSGYEVWRSETADGAYTLIKSTSYRYYTNSYLEPNKTYYYKVVAYRKVGDSRIYSTPCAPVSATPYFANVAGVKAVMSSASSIKISWSSVSGRTGYEVWRADTIGGEYTLIKSTSYTYYTDSNRIPNTPYYYKVVAYRTVNSIRYRSAYSSPVSATPYFGSVTNPKAARYSSTKIKLTWSSVSGRSGYEIYRATSYDGDYAYIGSTTSTYYYSSGLTTEQTYYYKIRAYRTVNGVRYYSDYSVVVSATP